MREYFKEQLDNQDLYPIESKDTKETSLYSHYQKGDKLVGFLFREFGNIDIPGHEPKEFISMRYITEGDIDKLEKEYKFIRMSEMLPLLEKL